MYSKVQGKNIVATYSYNTCHICNCDLLENSAHCIDTCSYLWFCEMWPLCVLMRDMAGHGSYIASCTRKGSGYMWPRILCAQILRTGSEFLVTYVYKQHIIRWYLYSDAKTETNGGNYIITSLNIGALGSCIMELKSCIIAMIELFKMFQKLIIGRRE